MKNIIIKEVSKDQLEQYAQIPILFTVTSKYELEKVNGGLGGIIFKEKKVDEYVKDYGIYESPLDWEKEFDISNWGFFIAYDNDKPVGAATLVFDTKGIRMLSNRKDLAVLWDIRIVPEYKSMGIGSTMFSHLIEWAKERKCTQIKIETQNINVPACKFYAKQGAKLGEINQYAYYGEEDDEVMLIWYLDL